jgi:hypothetical protein
MPAADQDIVDLNLFWLIKARELARHNRKKAAVVLGVDPGLLALFSRLSIGDLNTLARAGVMLFRPRFRSALWRALLASAASPALSVRLHTLFLAAGEQPER